ncbi:RluA family pseudouridine synthase [Dysgonomonas sp. 25]|uniref:RluA family pseudouridine synthase n=1 Tax=Dysgonomonas sp. 25 TaxID=2302933 RepID=UPI0013D6A1B5|nr:RluA family pseudouridine synthase [Dysgonomonas sp. 25]NDV67844.1 RluA family pseudouridine synthase [Dysgonomonas sp. 25]
MRKPAQDIVLQQFKIKEPAQLLSFLLEKQVRKSRNAVKSLLAHKQIKVNDKLITQFDLQLNPGDRVAVMKYNQARKRNPLKGLTIVFEDEYIIVIEKESGVLSIGTDKERTKTIFNVLNSYVKARYNKEDRIYVLHRLDREVSGLMIFAKDEETQLQFQKNWDKLVLDYQYRAIIQGQLDPPQGTIKSWLTENKNHVVFSSSFDNGGLEAITNYETVETSKHYSEVIFRLVTRRKNQVRAQMNQQKHPIVGDKKYGSTGNPIKRIALHGQEMILAHPVSGQKLEFKCPMPKAMQQLLKEKKHS